MSDQLKDLTAADIGRVIDAMDIMPCHASTKAESQKHWKRLLEDLMDGSDSLASNDDLASALFELDPWTVRYVALKAMDSTVKAQKLQAEVDSLRKAIAEDAVLERHATLAKLAAATEADKAELVSALKNLLEKGRGGDKCAGNPVGCPFSEAEAVLAKVSHV
jgi:hypothetical protein